VAFAHANLQAYDLGSHFQLVENMHRSTLVCRLLRVDSIEKSDDRILMVLAYYVVYYVVPKTD
jgi:hypothetical protein